MAETPESSAAPVAKSGKSGNMPLMAIIGIVLVLNLLIVGKVFLGGKGSGSSHSAEAGKSEIEEVGKKLPLEEFLVNLGDAGSEHYLKVTIVLGLRKDVDDKKLEEDFAPIKDAIISVLSNCKQDEVATEAGKTKLKEDLKGRINKRLGGKKVAEIYFTAFATQ